MTTSLLEEVARVLTDGNRMVWDNNDPARYSKRAAKALALDILLDAVARASRALELAKLIEDDIAATKENQK